jgi:hypothetical protein
MQRAISKGSTSFYTLSTSNAQVLVNAVLKKRIFNIFSVDGSGRAQLVLRSGIHFHGPWFQVTTA